jgi:hypothetical protein
MKKGKKSRAAVFPYGPATTNTGFCNGGREDGSGGKELSGAVTDIPL